MNFTRPSYKPAPKIEGIEQVTLPDRRFYRTPNGDEYLSATTLLKVLDDGGIDAWRKRVGEKEAQEIVEDAAGRGTHFHLLCEKYVTGEELIIPDLDPRHGVMFNRAKPHINKFSEIYASEYALYSDKVQAAGTVDIVGSLNGLLTVGDFKSARYAGKHAEWGKKKVFKYLIQCGGYGIMWYERYGQMPQQACIIMVSEYDLTCRFIVEPIKPFMKEFARVALAAQGKYPVEQLSYFKVFGGKPK